MSVTARQKALQRIEESVLLYLCEARTMPKPDAEKKDKKLWKCGFGEECLECPR